MELKDTLELLELARTMSGSAHPDHFTVISVADDILAYHDRRLQGRKELQSVDLPPKDVIELARRLEIPHPTKGWIPFRPYAFQTEYLLALNEGKRINLVISARQMGMSTCMGIQALWVAISQPNQTVVISSFRLSDGMELIHKIQRFIEASPSVAPSLTEFNKTSITFGNGSRIVARVVSGSTLDGLTPTWVMIQEAAFVPYKRFEEFWQANNQWINDPGSHMIIQSTPKWAEGPFYRLWASGSNTVMDRHTISWDLHPDRDEAWKAAQLSYLGQRTWDMEYECQFIDRPESSEAKGLGDLI